METAGTTHWSAAAHTGTTRTAVRRTGTVRTLHALAAAAEDVYAVDGVEHGVAVNTVILGVAALHGVDGAAEVALLVQDVIKLQRHGKGVVLKEALAKLRVPYQLVCVHRSVAITAAAVLMKVG